MAGRRKPPPRWSRPAAEAAIVMIALAFAFGAGVVGYVVGRESVDDDEPAAVETTTGGEPQPTTTAETETETEPTQTETGGDGGEDVDGAAVFTSAGCGSCHEFGPANSSGTIGPSLDGIDLSKDEIAAQVRNGGGAMPAFGDRLSDAEIDAVADYVENAG